MLTFITLSKALDKVIDCRGKTPKKLGGSWSKEGYKVLSALNIKTSGLANMNDIKFVNQEIYKLWMTEEIKKYDILLTSEAPPGQVLVWKSDEKIVLGQRLFALRVKKDFNPFFVKYFLQSEFGQREIFKNISGSTVTGISAKMFDFIKIPNFHKSIQQKIASVLSALDEKIELNNKINEELEKMARLLYDYWFVQFDFPDENGRPYKSSGGKMVWNEELKREIPEGWEVKRIIKLIDWIGGAQPPKSNFIYEQKPGYIRFIQNRDYNSEDNITYIPISDNIKTCDELDIMIDKYGEAGKVRFGLAGAYNVALAKIKVKYPNYQEYIRKFFESEATYEYLHKSCIASTRPSLNENILKNLLIIIPNNEKILEAFENHQKVIIKRILLNRKENKFLSEIRDWLLPMLMNGQVVVE